MREASSSTDRWAAVSPRQRQVRASYRPRSVREVYRPAVQDLSEQAARHGTIYDADEGILSVISSCTPRQTFSATSNPYPDRYHSPTPLMTPTMTPEEVIKNTPAPQLSNEFNEDLHRQRVLVSAHQRRQLNPRIQRSRSTPAGSRSSTRVNSAASAGYDTYRNSWQTTDVDNEKLELVVTNGFKLNSKDFKERINYRLTSRTKPKSAHSSLMANGAPLPVLNGYTQTLLQNFPQYSQKYCKWLTNGFKVQSFRTGHNTRFSHSRPPPPLLQYINRPKTVSGRLSSKKIPTNVDINVVGVQKEVSAQKQDVCDVTHDVM